MQLETIIAALKARCPVFQNRVAGAAQFKILPESSGLSVPCAYVIPLDDNPGESRSQNGVLQSLTDSFAVVVAISNVADERGQTGAANVHALRAALWSALLGWSPTERHGGVTYEGGSLVALDRARLWYQFEFGADMEIGGDDGWQQTELSNLPHFEGATIKLDSIDPMADPNLQSPGPDGRIEHEVRINDLPT